MAEYGFVPLLNQLDPSGFSAYKKSLGVYSSYIAALKDNAAKTAFSILLSENHFPSLSAEELGQLLDSWFSAEVKDLSLIDTYVDSLYEKISDKKKSVNAEGRASRYLWQLDKIKRTIKEKNSAVAQYDAAEITLMLIDYTKIFLMLYQEKLRLTGDEPIQTVDFQIEISVILAFFDRHFDFQKRMAHRRKPLTKEPIKDEKLWFVMLFLWAFYWIIFYEDHVQEGTRS